MIKKILNFKFVIRNCQRGMTYVELIVILSIFSALSAVVLFNYAEFQSRIDIKNLSNDIALKIVEAQKSAVAGRLPPFPQQNSVSTTWRTSYGVYFNPNVDNKSFSFFTDIDQDGQFDGSVCPGNGECLEQNIITKGNSISGLSVFYRGDPNAYNLNDLTITFIRPSGAAVFNSSTGFTSATIDYVQISIVSMKGTEAPIKVYASGKIDIN